MVFCERTLPESHWWILTTRCGVGQPHSNMPYNHSLLLDASVPNRWAVPHAGSEVFALLERRGSPLPPAAPSLVWVSRS